MNLPKKRFTKINEGFQCGNCGANVPPLGSGSCRNHCNKCLWSMHLDVNPGDRLADCGGLMEPVSIEKKHGEYRILHRCVRCGAERWNKSAPDDDLIGYYESKTKN